jgi:hypothetical protein
MLGACRRSYPGVNPFIRGKKLDVVSRQLTTVGLDIAKNTPGSV